MNSKLTSAIERAWNVGRQRWPDIAVDRAQYTERILAHVKAADDVEAIHAEDLYLACGCMLGRAKAYKAFEESILPGTVGALRRLDSSADFADEVHQQLREKLFIGTDTREPRIRDYAARGPLHAWVRVSAVRLGLNLRATRRRNQPVTLERVAEVLPTGNPSVEYLKSQYSTEFNEALASAMSALSQQDRTIMRLKFVDSLNIEQIGTIYNVHRATVARWLTRIREELFAITRSELEERLSLSGSEFESLLALVRSRIDFSVSVLLQAESE